MRPLNQFKNPGIRFLFCDIDDTITDNGKLPDRSLKAMWEMFNAGINVIPVTGRPAGWCEMIARFWPVGGIVGENGGFYFRYNNKKMIRHFAIEESQRIENRKKLNTIAKNVLENIKGSAIASDQFCRLMDLAIDYCEDVKPLDRKHVDEILKIFKEHGAQAKLSSIHVNGWFGDYDKLSMCKEFIKREHDLNIDDYQAQSFAFVGDSPNDQPMFKYFTNSFAVANISKFIDDIEDKPSYVTIHESSKGFCNIVEKILEAPQD